MADRAAPWELKPFLAKAAKCLTHIRSVDRSADSYPVFMPTQLALAYGIIGSSSRYRTVPGRTLVGLQSTVCVGWHFGCVTPPRRARAGAPCPPPAPSCCRILYEGVEPLKAVGTGRIHHQWRPAQVGLHFAQG